MYQKPSVTKIIIRAIAVALLVASHSYSNVDFSNKVFIDNYIRGDSSAIGMEIQGCQTAECHIIRGDMYMFSDSTPRLANAAAQYAQVPVGSIFYGSAMNRIAISFILINKPKESRKYSDYVIDTWWGENWKNEALYLRILSHYQDSTRDSICAYINRFDNKLPFSKAMITDLYAFEVTTNKDMKNGCNGEAKLLTMNPEAKKEYDDYFCNLPKEAKCTRKIQLFSPANRRYWIETMILEEQEYRERKRKTMFQVIFVGLGTLAFSTLLVMLGSP